MRCSWGRRSDVHRAGCRRAKGPARSPGEEALGEGGDATAAGGSDALGEAPRRVVVVDGRLERARWCCPLLGFHFQGDSVRWHGARRGGMGRLQAVPARHAAGSRSVRAPQVSRDA
jgi:hypothetical protein